MMTRRWMMMALLWVGLIALLAACDDGGSGATSSLTGNEPASQLTIEEAEQVAETFLNAWEQADYTSMYNLITPNSRDAYTQDEFISVYDNTAVTLTQASLETQLTSSLRQGTTTAIQYDTIFHTEMFGDISDFNRTLRVIETPEGWRVAWSTMDIFAELAEGAYLNRDQRMPGRGNIYDRNGKVLADQNGKAISLYLVKQDIPDQTACLNLLSSMLHKEYSKLEQDLIGWAPETLFFIGDTDPETYQLNEQDLLNTCDIGDDAYDTVTRNTRRYFAEVAPHVVGYVGLIQGEQAAEYARQGYPPDAQVGQAGVEKTYEKWLAGKPSGRLVIYGPGGEELRVLGESTPVPGQSVYLTIDRDLQQAVQNAFTEAYNVGTVWSGTSRGAAAVIMNVKTGEILAMVSYPGFDPGLFNRDTPVYDPQAAILELNSDFRTPLLNRATMGAYPAGSVFKIISTAAGLDSGVYTPDTGLTCTGTWYGAEYGDGRDSRTDWLPPPGHGYVNFRGALAQSCDPYYWQLGVALHNADPKMLTNYAYEMGLGVPTGLADLEELVGQIPNEELIFRLNARSWNISDTLNMVIGQGEMQITPLQIAHMVAAIANGGTLYKPYLVSKVQLIGETPAYVAQPTALSVLDYDPSVFQTIRDAMCDVTLDVNGTANYMFEDWYDFQGKRVIVCGKTGTAQTGSETTNPQAWFVAYAPQDDPEIAVAVIVENSCEGSEVAAPIVRRIIEDYYQMPHGEWPPLWQTGCSTTAR